MSVVDIFTSPSEIWQSTDTSSNGELKIKPKVGFCFPFAHEQQQEELVRYEPVGKIATIKIGLMNIK